jgi:hypothetical protein
MNKQLAQTANLRLKQAQASLAAITAPSKATNASSPSSADQAEDEN